jgi:lipopolysaccharide transport system permease protein
MTRKSVWSAFLLIKVRANLTSEMSNNYLSYLWWIIEPILFIAVLYFVFGLMLRRGDENFVYYLAIGVSFWLWFSSAVSHSVLSIVGAGPLLQQVYLPKILLPLICVFVDTFKQLLVIAVLLLFLAFAGGFFSVNWLALLPLFLAQFLVNVAASLWVAAIIPFVPDLRFMVTMTLSLLMFCSGIFYDLKMIAPDFNSVIMFNPIANLIIQYRAVLMYGEWPDWTSIAWISIAAFVLAVLAALVIQRYDRYYPRLAIQ